MQNRNLQSRVGWYACLLAVTGVVFFYVSCKKTDGGAFTSHFTIMPTSGPAGNLVTITGSGFSADITRDSVQFNGLAAQVVNVSATQLQVYVPVGVTTGPVTVFADGRQATGPVYTVSTVGISSLSLAAGLTGDSVVISGMGLSNTGGLSELAGLPTVKFNKTTATVVSATPTRVVALVPGRAGTGPVTVTIGGETATGPVFNYLGIDSLYPATGNVGTSITLLGGFGLTPGQDTVTINGVKMAVDSASPEKLVVKAPSGGQTGTVVMRTGGRQAVGSVFTFVPLPVFSGMAPISGPPGIKVTITGTGFSKQLKENSVSFNGIAGSVVSVTPTQLIVVAPAGVSTGPVSVTVNGQVAKGTMFTVQGLGISSISPLSFIPPEAADTINGVGFSTIPGQNIVQFNGKSVTVLSASDTQLVVSIPAGVTSGAVSVRVGSLTAAGPTYSTVGVATLIQAAGGGFTDGPPGQAEFIALNQVAMDVSGNFYVTDYQRIRKIGSDGTVTTIAGDPTATGVSGYVDGPAALALFNSPDDLVLDKSGNIYVADGNPAIRKITPGGEVSTFATLPSGNPPGGIAIDAAGNIYAGDRYGAGNYYEFDPGGALINSVVIPNAGGVNALAIDAMGNVYAGDGSENVYKGADLIVKGTTYGTPGLAFDNSGNLIVVNQGLSQIFLVNPTSYAATVLTGGAGVKGKSGYADGPLPTALFATPFGVKVDQFGILYIVDKNNQAIRKVSLK